MDKFDRIIEEIIALLDFLIGGFIILYNDIIKFITTVTLETQKGEKATISRWNYYKAFMTGWFCTFRWRIARLVIGKKLLNNTADACPFCHETVFVFNEGKYRYGQLPFKPKSKTDIPVYGLIASSFYDIDLDLLIVHAVGNDKSEVRDLWLISKKELVLTKDMTWVNKDNIPEGLGIQNTIFTTLELQNILNVMRSKK